MATAFPQFAARRLPSFSAARQLATTRKKHLSSCPVKPRIDGACRFSMSTKLPVNRITSSISCEQWKGLSNGLVARKRNFCRRAVKEEQYMSLVMIRSSVQPKILQKNSSYPRATFSSTPLSKTREREQRQRLMDRFSTRVCLVLLTVGVSASAVTRRWRHQKIEELPIVTAASWSEFCSRHDNMTLEQLINTVTRMGLMGKKSSVKAELQQIRQWHHDHGYLGGIVVRDLTQPLSDDVAADFLEQKSEEVIDDPNLLSRRECYYLYYEVTGTGTIHQEIYCRGTTLLSDFLTCLQAWSVYDVDLQCRVHAGFVQRADRILQDVQPLLAPVQDRRAVVSVCGHSLGAAVATILAVKLAKRGYRVKRLVTVGQPRLCASRQDAAKLLPQLPENHLRIENDLDFVSYVPFSGVPVGNKLWLVGGQSVWGSDDTDTPPYVSESARLVYGADAAKGKCSWTESIWINLRLFEVLRVQGQPHRIPHYVQNLRRLLQANVETNKYICKTSEKSETVKDEPKYV